MLYTRSGVLPLRHPTAQILSQGDEVVTGQIADTNAAWLSEQLTDLGLRIRGHRSVGDVVEHIAQDLTEAVGVDVCVCTGGLGPTQDDLTAEAVSLAFDRPLRHDPVAEAHIRALYRRFKREMPEVNLKQALLPEGAIRLDNRWGTAPGFALVEGSTWFAFVPGVPREMRAMFAAHIHPAVAERLQLAPGRLVVLRTTGVGESTLQQRLGTFERPGVTLSYRTTMPENHIKLRFSPTTTDAEATALIDELTERIGSPLFGIDGSPEPTPRLPSGDLATVVGKHLVRHDATLAVAESCTGGRIASMCTGIPGSSTWFVEGVVTYANRSKIERLGVPGDDIAQHGAVSEPVARAMAAGIRRTAGTTYGVATTGIAGPGGGSDAKPVGTVHLALATPDGVHHRQVHMHGDRHRIQKLAAAAALDLLRRHLS